jgi:dTDP-4-amino-4,6-dideoxygalactose transaminase
MKKIPIAKPLVGRHEIRAVKRVLKSGSLAQGPEVARFEKEFSKFVMGRECVAVNSGTSALQLALLSVGVEPGDEVIVPSFSFAATANSVALVGAKPVFVDIDPLTFNIDPKKIESAISSRTRAIQVVHLYGLPANMPKIMEIAKQWNLLVIEDAAQAHLASIDGKPVGTYGDAAAFSFYPTKNMTTGEGGMVVFSDSSFARRSRLLRNQGMEKRYQNEIVGYNLRMTDINAAIGLQQLKCVKSWTEKRISNANLLSDRIAQAQTPLTPHGFHHVFHQYTVRIPKKRDFCANYLDSVGVGNGVYYPTPIHMLPSFNLDLELIETKLATEQVLSLPVHPSLSRKDLLRIANSVDHAIQLSHE